MNKYKDLLKLIEFHKMKRFSMERALKFWDNFDVDLYARILKEKNK